MLKRNLLMLKCDVTEYGVGCWCLVGQVFRKLVVYWPFHIQPCLGVRVYNKCLKRYRQWASVLWTKKLQTEFNNWFEIIEKHIWTKHQPYWLQQRNCHKISLIKWVCIVYLEPNVKMSLLLLLWPQPSPQCHRIRTYTEWALLHGALMFLAVQSNALLGTNPWPSWNGLTRLKGWQEDSREVRE